MNLNSIRLLLTIFALAFVGCKDDPSSSEPSYGYRGVVRDSSTQAPLEGVAVTGVDTSASAVVVYSDSHGYFHRELPVDSTTLYFRFQSYVTESRTMKAGDSIEVLMSQ